MKRAEWTLFTSRRDFSPDGGREFQNLSRHAYTIQTHIYQAKELCSRMTCLWLAREVNRAVIALAEEQHDCTRIDGYHNRFLRNSTQICRQCLYA